MPLRSDIPAHPNHLPSLFSVQGLSYSYTHAPPVLQDIDLTIAQGERLAVLGQNGSGKTTLIKLLSGLLFPSSGSVCYKGHPLQGSFLHKTRLHLGILFQDPDDQLFCTTLVQDVAFGPRQQGLDAQDAEAAARQALTQVGLERMAYKAPHNLSFGQKKRAALAGLLAMRPQVLFLDEPTANLDPGQEQVFLDLLTSFPGTLICISHDVIFLYELCQRALILDQGRIHHDSSMHDLITRPETLRAYGLDFTFRLLLSPEHIPAQSQPEAWPMEDHPPSMPSEAKSGPGQIVLAEYGFSYPDGTRALQDVHLRIEAGQRVAIVGENGAGKTTLLSCLIGLSQGRGVYRFQGAAITARSRKKLWRHMGMVFQDCSDQLFCSSVREEVAFGLRRLGLSRTEARMRIQRALNMVDLQGFEDRVPLHLSGGERKRLALACVLAMRPQVLILDEPTAGLDPQGEQMLLGLLRDLDMTMLLITHDMFFIQELTQRTLVMHQGRILEDMSTHSFLQDENLGTLNGLAFMYRRQTLSQIQALHHQHEHTHLHHHLHTHPHRHGDLVHTHKHEHTHTHSHRFVHTHPKDAPAHDHMPRRYHDHDHPDHDREAHEHSHE